jgi:hypothetical protein
VYYKKSLGKIKIWLVNYGKIDYTTNWEYTYVTWWFNPFVTSGTYYVPLTKSFQVRWDNSIPLFLHTAIYLEVSLFRWTRQNALSCETAVYKCCFAGKCILTGSTEQRYFKVDGNVEKKWDTVIPADLKSLFVSGTYMSHWLQKG